MKRSLSGKTLVISGASRGIGLAIALRAARDGANIAVLAKTVEAHPKLPGTIYSAAQAIEAAGGRALPLACDIRDTEQIEAAVAKTVETFGGIDVLVNNAGIPPGMRPLPFRQTTPDDWGPFLDINIVGVLNCTRAVIDGMCERGHGRVITISSGSGTHGQNIGVSLYGAGKGGAISFMRHLALETARDGVTANTLAIGLMEREGGPSEITEKMARMIPVGRTGTPDDIGYAVTFLASDEAAWITGQTIAVNGGSTTS